MGCGGPDTWVAWRSRPGSSVGEPRCCRPRPYGSTFGLAAGGSLTRFCVHGEPSAVRLLGAVRVRLLPSQNATHGEGREQAPSHWKTPGEAERVSAWDGGPRACSQRGRLTLEPQLPQGGRFGHQPGGPLPFLRHRPQALPAPEKLPGAWDWVWSFTFFLPSYPAPQRTELKRLFARTPGTSSKLQAGEVLAGAISPRGCSPLRFG